MQQDILIIGVLFPAIPLMMKAVMKLSNMACLYTGAIGRVQTGGADVCGKPSRGLRCRGLPQADGWQAIQCCRGNTTVCLKASLKSDALLLAE